MKETASARESRVARIGFFLALPILLTDACIGPGSAQEVGNPNPLPAMAGEWDVMSRAWIGPDAPRVRLLKMIALVSEDGSRLSISEAGADNTVLTRREYTYSSGDGGIHGFTRGVTGIPSEDHGVFDESGRTLTIFSVTEPDAGQRFRNRIEWTIVSEKELRRTVYLVDSSGKANRFSEAIFLRRS